MIDQTNQQTALATLHAAHRALAEARVQLVAIVERREGITVRYRVALQRADGHTLIDARREWADTGLLLLAARVGLATAAAGLSDTLRRETGWGRETSHALADARALGNARWAAGEQAAAAATRGERPPTPDVCAATEAVQALQLEHTARALLDQTTERARDQRASAGLVGEIIGQWADRQAHLDSLVTEAMQALD